MANMSMSQQRPPLRQYVWFTHGWLLAGQLGGMALTTTRVRFGRDRPILFTAKQR